jgi:hypothetical protein
MYLNLKVEKKIVQYLKNKDFLINSEGKVFRKCKYVCQFQLWAQEPFVGLSAQTLSSLYGEHTVTVWSRMSEWHLQPVSCLATERLLWYLVKLNFLTKCGPQERIKHTVFWSWLPSFLF